MAAVIDISLRVFLLTGNFGPVTGPVLREELRTLLGPPDDFGVLPRRQTGRRVVAPDGTRTHVRPAEKTNAGRAAIWKYGSFEFHFNKEGWVWMVFADNFDRLRGSESIRLAPWHVRGQAARSAIEAALRRTRIRYDVRKPEYDPTQTHLVTASGVELSFIEVEETGYPSPGLWAICRRWE